MVWQCSSKIETLKRGKKLLLHINQLQESHHLFLLVIYFVLIRGSTAKNAKTRISRATSLSWTMILYLYYCIALPVHAFICTLTQVFKTMCRLWPHKTWEWGQLEWCRQLQVRITRRIDQPVLEKFVQTIKMQIIIFPSAVSKNSTQILHNQTYPPAQHIVHQRV